MTDAEEEVWSKLVAERDEFQRRAELWERLHDKRLDEKQKISVVLCRVRMPEPYLTVIVKGGLATWTGKYWLSRTGDDSGRPIQWNVVWWRELIMDSDTDCEPVATFGI